MITVDFEFFVGICPYKQQETGKCLHGVFCNHDENKCTVEECPLAVKIVPKVIEAKITK